MFIAKPFTLSKGEHAGKIIAEVNFSAGEDIEETIKNIVVGNDITFEDGSTYQIQGIERQGYNDPFLPLGKPIGLLLKKK